MLDGKTVVLRNRGFHSHNFGSEYHIATARSVTPNNIIKTLRGKKDYAIKETNISSVKRISFFSVWQREERKLLLYSEIGVGKKGHTPLKYRNRQCRSAIWSSMFMFNQPFFSIAFFLLFRPTKRWTISHQIIAFAVVILSRFQCITWVVW